MRVNVSQVKAYQRSPLYWRYQYVENRVPRGFASALAAGTAAHSAMARHLEGEPMVEALKRVGEEVGLVRTNALQEGQVLEVQKYDKDWAILRELLLHWQDRYDFTTLAIEQELTMRCGSHTLYGTPDRIARWGDKLWHVQTRTLSGTTPVGPYLAAAPLDLHERAYGALIDARYDEPYGGTMFNIIRKLPLYGKRGLLRAADECFVQEFVPIPARLVGSAVKGISRLADRMEQDIANDALLCSDTCRLGRYGNSLCPYAEVCMGVARLDDDSRFIDRVEDR